MLLLVIPLQQGLAAGLIIMACAAGAPFLPKPAQTPKGNVAFAVALMALLVVTTVVYLPLALPLLLPKAAISPWAIAQSLVVMLLLLAIGLFVKARCESSAAPVTSIH